MTNKSFARGGVPIGIMTAATFNAQSHRYLVTAADLNKLYKYDFVKLVGTSNSEGIPYVTKAAAGEKIIGVIDGIKNIYTKEEHIYRAVGYELEISVLDDPFLVVEIQASGTITSADIGKCADLLVADGNDYMGTSGTQLDLTTLTTKSAQLKIIGISETVNNEWGLYSKLRCIIAEHELKDIPVYEENIWDRDDVTGLVTLHVPTDDVQVGADLEVVGKLTVGGLIDPTGLLLDPQAAPPSTADGTIYYDTVEGFQLRNQGVWIPLDLWDRELIGGGLYRLNPHHSLTDRINTSTGYQIGKNDIFTVTGTDNMFIGLGTNASITTGEGNLFIGQDAGTSVTVGSYNCFGGFESGKDAVDGTYNSSYGYKALTSVTSGSYNTAFGELAATAVTTSSGVVAIGAEAAKANDTDYFIAIGYKAGYTSASGTGDIYIGKEAGLLATGDYNTIISQEGGKALTTGERNTLIGSRVGALLTTQSGNIHIGNQAGAQSTDSNKLFVDNSNTTTPLIGGDFASDTLNFRGIASYYSHPLFATDTQLVDKKYVDDHPGTAAEVYKLLTPQILVGGETSFILDTIPLTPGMAQLYLKGQKLTYGAGNDFTIAGNILTYSGVPALVKGDIFDIYYDFSAGGIPLVQTQVYYVGDAGDNSYHGKSYDFPVKTLAQAITLVLAQTPSSSNRFEIQIIGATAYTENITIPTYTKIIGTSAKLTGTVTMSAESALQIKEHVVGAGVNGILADAVTAYFDADKQTGGAASTGLAITNGGTLRATIKNVDQSGAGSKTYGVSLGGVLYLNGEKLRENAASTNDGSGTVFMQIADYGASAQTFIYNEAGNIVIDAKGHSIKLTDSAVGDIMTSTGVYHQFPNAPSFEAYETTAPANVTGDGTLYTPIFNSEIEDIGANYNNATGIFKTPVAGKYEFFYILYLTGFAAHTQLEIFLSAGANTFYSYNIDPSGIKNAANEVCLAGSFTCLLGAAADVTVRVRVSGGAKVIGLKGLSFSKFSGILLTA